MYFENRPKTVRRMIPEISNDADIYRVYGNARVTFVYEMVLRSRDEWNEYGVDYTPERLIGRDVWAFATPKQQQVFRGIIRELVNDHGLPLMDADPDEDGEDRYFLAPDIHAEMLVDEAAGEYLKMYP